MTFEILNIIGTIAFAASGALVALEEEFDFLGVIVLGLATAFGGGIVRNLLIGVPIPSIWEQDKLIMVAIGTILILFVLPAGWINYYWEKWGSFFDAIGLSAFAIQGALYAESMGLPFIAAMVAAAMTGTGGGIIRDLLARRKPTVLQKEVYAVWAMMAGLLIGLGYPQGLTPLMILFGSIVFLRMLSLKLGWKLPYRSLS
ncbi:trimeric intracellular cation channel family protein [Guptibacillus algicola]|uniref:trimeric intracellular cation channel family protein n=1 Tax=Guptibacillus algicola TaxID=225844 RepID=UPI001CD6EC47|nr:trimeric intracellular cation channel family protein [Alkalihalobacillus algicola]MCA0985715.1 trimeric intracellular cation channel family protein [Alkalihalobacillus algicola]